MVGQSKTAMVVLAILVAACAGAAVGETTTTGPVEDPSTMATTEVDAATTILAEPVDICRPGPTILWEPGRSYFAECFLVPVSFAPVDSGWRTTGVESDRFLITLVESSEAVAEVALLGYRPSAGLDGVVNSILELEGPMVSAQSQMTVDGQPAVMFEVETGLDPRPIGADWSDCYSNSLGTSLATNGPGWRLLFGELDRYNEYGFAPCRTFRVWVVDAAGGVITLIATAEREETLQESMPIIERLLDSITFEAP